MTSNKNATLLVTGASGFLGGHVVKQALERGYSVRVTARSEESARRILESYAEGSAERRRLSYAVVPELTRAESYKRALLGDDGGDDGEKDTTSTAPVTGVLHLASPFIFDPEDNERDLLDPAIRGSTAVLEAVARWAPSVARVVATSSLAAVIDDRKGARPGYTYTEVDWNPATYGRAAASPDGAYAYRASKALAERAMFDWVAENRRRRTKSDGRNTSFALTTICPPWIYGPCARDPATPSERLSESVRLFAALLVDAPEIPPFDFGGYADVREVAAAHLLALEQGEEEEGEEGKDGADRRFIIGQQFRYQAAADAAREALPELRDRLPVGTPGHIEPGYAIDGSSAAAALGLRYMTLKETVADMLSQLLRSGHIRASAEAAT